MVNAGRRLIIIGLILLGVANPGRTQGRDLDLGSLPATAPLIDEGFRDPSFVAMRKQLIGAAAGGDIEAVMRLIDSNVQVHQEKQERGIAALRNEWKIEASSAEFLKELQTVLSLGGRMNEQGTEFVAPYVATLFADRDPDYLGFYGVVVQEGAALYRDGSTSSPILARLSYNVVGFYPYKNGFVSVELRDGRKGFLKADSVRSPIMTRARFKKIDGQWKLVEFNRDYH